MPLILPLPPPIQLLPRGAGDRLSGRSRHPIDDTYFRCFLFQRATRFILSTGASPIWVIKKKFLNKYCARPAIFSNVLALGPAATALSRPSPLTPQAALARAACQVGAGLSRPDKCGFPLSPPVCYRLFLFVIVFFCLLSFFFRRRRTASILHRSPPNAT